MFFMLSGFLMSLGYRGRIRDGQISFGSFLKKRLGKLYPMFAVTNLAALAVEVWQYGISAVNLKKIAFTFLLQQGGMNNENPYNSPTWFVGALFVCYLLHYAGSYYRKTDTQYRLFLAGCIAWGYYLLMADLKVPFGYACNGLAFQNYFLGCAMAEVLPYLKKQGRWLKPTVFAGLLACAYLLWDYGVEVISGDSSVAFSFVICPMILYLACADGLCSRILRWKPLVYMGELSMELFYWHLVVFFAMRQVLGNMTPAGFALYLTVLVLVSLLTQRISAKYKAKTAVHA